MNKSKYIMTTPYGSWYEIAENGGVVKCDNGLNKTNSTETELMTWQILGIVEIKPFNHLGHLIPLHEAVKLDNFSFKNGKPKYTIVDLDHGTRRVHGNWRYHGVRSVRLVD